MGHGLSDRFLTSSSEYAWDAFPVHPFDYLLKPIDKARLARVLDEAERAVQRRERTLSLKVGRQVELVNVSAVSYVNARDHYVYVGLTDGREINATCPLGKSRRCWEKMCAFWPVTGAC